MKKYVLFILGVWMCGSSIKAQSEVPDTFISHQRVNLALGMKFRNYGKPSLEEVQTSILNWERSRSIGLGLNLNYCLGPSFQSPKYWVVSGIFNASFMPMGGTLVLDAETFNLDYTHRLSIRATGATSRIAIGITRRQELNKKNNYWLIGGQLGLSSFSMSKWQGSHLITAANGTVERLHTYEFSGMDVPQSSALNFALQSGFIFNGPGLLKFELGLETLLAPRQSTMVSIITFQDPSNTVRVPFNYTGLYVSLHLHRNERGKNYNEAIMKRHYSAE